MLSTTKAIVISQIKYGENDLIIKCYTETYGLISFLIKSAFSTKKKIFNSAYFQPLSQIQVVFNYTKNRNLYHIKEVSSNKLYSTLHTHIYKSTVVIFLSEILNSCIIEEEGNIAMYSYLETSLVWFDTISTATSFHLLFLLKLTKYLGFYPDKRNINFNYFNLEEGCFQAENAGKLSISGENLILLKQLLGTTFDALPTIKINAKERQSFLRVILRYFELHLANFNTPKSLKVLNQVFN